MPARGKTRPASVQRIARALAAMFVCMLGFPNELAGQAHPASNLFRSTLHGIELDLSDGWRRMPYGMCGTGLIGLPERRIPLNVRYWHDQDDVSLAITSWIEFAADTAQRMRGLTRDAGSYTVSDLETEQTTLTRYHWSGRKDGRLTYIYDDPPRRAEFVFTLPPGRDDLVTKADELMETFRAAEPWTDEPRTQWKTAEGAGFSVSYPGDWRWQRPAVDSSDGPPKQIRILGPRLRVDDRDWDVSIAVERVPNTDKVNLASELRRSLKTIVNEYGMRATLRACRSSAGRNGHALEIRSRSGDVSYVVTTYYYEVNDTEWLTMWCGLVPEARWPEIKPVIEKMAACLIIHENQP